MCCGGFGYLLESLTIGVFGVEPVVSRPGPWQQVVIAAVGHTVVTDANYFLLLVHYTRPHLQDRRHSFVSLYIF